jgi:hypothetical protein
LAVCTGDHVPDLSTPMEVLKVTAGKDKGVTASCSETE